MASYTDLRGIFNDSVLRNQVVMATVVAAYELVQGAPTANDRAWASLVAANPQSEGMKVFMFILAANRALTISTIQGASDSSIQTQVDAVVPSLVLALAGA